MPQNPFKDLKNRVRALLLGARRDPETGHLYHMVDHVRHFIRFPHEIVRSRDRRFWYEQVYFREYRPSGSDCVVDLGAGLGTEIIPLSREAPDLRYFAVEIQPWVYECLCLTLAQLPATFVPVGSAISEEAQVRIDPTREGLDASIKTGGRVPVATMTWSEFCRRWAISRVDLLKMNVEGAEAELIDHIDLAMVSRIILSFHDFRAERGEGEQFRTRAKVEARLQDAGFLTKLVSSHWLFADRPPR